MKIIIINGPNLNLLGKRETAIYGNMSFDEYFEKLRQEYETVFLEHYQSNIEGELITKIQEADFSFDGIILNAGGYSHTSIAIADAIAAIATPVIEVHISNISAREGFRHNSFISAKSKGVIMGLGLNSYRLAVEAFQYMKMLEHI